MQAFSIHDYGQTPAAREAAIPEAGPGDVLIRVAAAALNPLDVHLAKGTVRQFFPIAFPHVMGCDLAGTVEAVGRDVTDWRPGDAVIAWPDAAEGGGMAEYAAVPATSLVALPPSLSFEEGAAIPTAGSTAYHALFSAARLQAGETVLIHAGAGGVGTFAVQFAHKAGARVIATASGDGVALVRSLGADEAIDHRTEDFTGLAGGVDIVLDLVGGETQTRSFGLLRAGGRLVSTVAPLDDAAARAHGASATMFYARPYSRRLGEVVDAVAGQRIAVVIDSSVPPDAFGQAWARQVSGRARGKVIVAFPHQTA